MLIQNSFDWLESKKKEIKKIEKVDCFKVLIGTRILESRQVTQQEAQLWADKNFIDLHIDVCSISGTNTEMVVQSIINHYCEHYEKIRNVIGLDVIK